MLVHQDWPAIRPVPREYAPGMLRGAAQDRDRCKVLGSHKARCSLLEKDMILPDGRDSPG